ncbi:MAG: c-type cytochrome [Bacteroidetes bacterium]|nr:MAG: c-type cytochrome [Bacteroidota bacterium]
MHSSRTSIYLRIIVSLFIFLLVTCKQKIEQIYPSRSIEISSGYAQNIANHIRNEVSLDIANDFELSLWAADTLVNDPIAISIDDHGRVFYTSAIRQTNSEFDIRSHKNWMTASISFETVEDRRAFLRETFSETNEEGRKFLKDLNQDGQLDWKDLTAEKEQVWFVEDVSGDGLADRAQMYLEDFNQEITDVANGIEAHNGEVFIAVGPDLWRTGDRDNDGIADIVTSISHGYAVHIGFGAHGMSGAKIGPDGRIWWGIGDIGMNVVDQTGKRWKYPNQGVIVRSELDGSGFEVYAAGLRNTHEFVFDKYGNLISVDNDGDHQGERERLVYLINGSETGWRINWQFGKYTDPDNNSYKVWMDERMHVPHWDGQAAYFLPPIANYVNGPTGLVYNPGTALDEKWYNHFFVAEFRGTPVNSPLHAFTLKPKGATFELAKTQEVVRGVLPTGVDFGPDGALYFSDWVDGWEPEGKGRIWKLDVPGKEDDPLRQEVKSLLARDFNENPIEELNYYLGHQDMRVRQKAQFQMATRGQKGFKSFLSAISQEDNQLTRIHGIWGIGQMARKGNMKYADQLIPLLSDQDPEIVTQAAKTLGDVRYLKGADRLIPLLGDNSLRVQLHAAEALGRMAYKPALDPLLTMLEKNNDRDIWLRHAGMIALSRLGEAASLAALNTYKSQAVRTAAVVALRRMKSPKIAQFLQDPEEYIVTEAARGINDDLAIPQALTDLATILKEPRFQGEPLLRRAINANLREGEQENIDILVSYIQQDWAPTDMRGEALQTLSTWGNPSVFDRVDGRYLGPVERDETYLKEQLTPVLAKLLGDQDPLVQLEAAKAAGKLKIQAVEDLLADLAQNHPSPGVRSTSLDALFNLQSGHLNQALETAFKDRDEEVRSTALAILPLSNIPEEQAVDLFKQIMQAGTYPEQQVALNSLGTLKRPPAVEAMSIYLNWLLSAKARPEIRLDIIEAVKTQGDKQLTAKLAEYMAEKSPEDPLGPFLETLNGGNSNKGQDIFWTHEAAQCVRCHTIFETGGTMGPGLSGVGSRLSSNELLTALVSPSGSFADGYHMLTLKLQGGETVTGLVLSETADSLTLKIGNQEVREVAKSNINQQRSIPSSMPPMGQVLTKKEIRDVLAFLGTLRVH